MPHRFAGHRLPAVIYAQPFETGIATILLISGVAMSITPAYIPSSIVALSWPWVTLFRILVFGAGVFMYAGLFRGRHRWSFTAEMAGMVMGGTVFASYAAGLAATGNPAALVAVATNLVIALACAVKVRALWIEAHARLQLIRQLPLPKDGTDGRGN